MLALSSVQAAQGTESAVPPHALLRHNEAYSAATDLAITELLSSMHITLAHGAS
jgi:hypothetical protein